MNNSEIVATCEIEKDIDSVFSFIFDPKNKPMVMPDLISVSNISDFPLKLGSTFNFVFQMAGVSLNGIWEVTSVNKPIYYEATTTGDIESVWRYKLAKLEDKTNLSLTITYTPPKSVLGAMKGLVLSQVNKRVAELYLKNIKTILET
jgi:uncharacterized membrane protein